MSGRFLLDTNIVIAIFAKESGVSDSGASNLAHSSAYQTRCRRAKFRRQRTDTSQSVSQVAAVS